MHSESKRSNPPRKYRYPVIYVEKFFNKFDLHIKMRIFFDNAPLLASAQKEKEYRKAQGG